MIWVTARARGWVSSILVLVTSVLLIQVAGQISADLPLADGPRRLRQYLIAFLPAGMAPCLHDRFPGLSKTLLREPLMRSSCLALYWVGLLLVFGPGWVVQFSPLAAYEILTCLVLGAVVLAVTAGWGSHGMLVGLLLGLVWLLAGDSIGAAIGFTDFLVQAPGAPEQPLPGHIPLLLVGAAVAALLASVALLRSHRAVADDQG